MQRTIDRAHVSYTEDERHELLSEGLAILLELSDRYRALPARPGIDKQAGRFSGYAAMFLPRRLGDAWHSWHPEHSYVTDPATGKRRWSYGTPAVSLDGLNNSGGGDDGGAGIDGHLLNARGVRDFVPTATASFQPPGRTP